jgi:RNA polymerase sigma factor (sigma-70 family)
LRTVPLSGDENLPEKVSTSIRGEDQFQWQQEPLSPGSATMTRIEPRTLLCHLGRLTRSPWINRLDDSQLLNRFTTRRDEMAFAVLVERYGPLVMGVCRRVLRHTQDAEDVFQAVFLVLARKADSIRTRQALGGWLYQVAYHLALKAKTGARRRGDHEQRRAGMANGGATAEQEWYELRFLLDEELQRLPERCRLALVTCYLEGRTQDEAARSLRWSKATLRRRLEEGRELLRVRLVRRGFTLSGALIATLLGEGTASAAVPGELASQTLRAVAGAPIAPTVATLVEGGLLRVGGRWKLATALLLVGGLLAGGVLIHPSLPAPPAPAAPPTAKAAVEKPRPAATEIVVRGRVHGPDDKPLAGARVSLVTSAVRNKADLVVRATSDEAGRFHFTTALDDFAYGATLVVQAKGHPPDWVRLTKPPADEVRLHLPADDVPITARVLDLEGRPIAGVSARVLRIGKVTEGDLKAWLDKNVEMRRKGSYLNDNGLSTIRADLLDLPAKATTGADGTLRLSGFGRDRVVRLDIEGPSIVWRKMWVVTRPGPARGFIPGFWGVYGASFEYIASPCKPIVGTVREKGTGEPLAGITVGSLMHGDVQTRTDNEGRYRIVGVAKNPRYAIAAEGQHHFNCTKHDIADTPGLESIRVDFELERGILLRGRVTNKVTGEPVRGSVFYVARADNPHLKDYTEFAKILKAHLSNPFDTAADGSFTQLALPGPGLLCVRANNGAFLTVKPVDARGVALKVVPGIVLSGHHALVPVQVVPDDPKTHKYDIALDPGRSVQGRVIGPDGRPLPGARVAGLTSTPATEGEDDPRIRTLKSAEFTVAALDPQEMRALIFLHRQRNLGAMVRVRGDEKGPLTVELEPLGNITGRAVDASGHALAGLTVKTRQVNPAFDQTTTTDKEGRFRVTGLLPRTPFLLAIAHGDPWERRSVLVYRDDELSVESGESKELGDLKPKMPRRK